MDDLVEKNSEGSYFFFNSVSVKFFSTTGTKVLVGDKVKWQIKEDGMRSKKISPNDLEQILVKVITTALRKGYLEKDIRAIVIPSDLAVSLFLSGVIVPSDLQKAQERHLQSTSGINKDVPCSNMVVLANVQISNLGAFQIVIMPKNVLAKTGPVAINTDWQKI